MYENTALNVMFCAVGWYAFIKSESLILILYPNLLLPILFDQSDTEFESPDYRREIASPIHDLSAWRVSIPRVEKRIDDRKEIHVYIIQVQRIDVLEGANTGEKTSWEVER